MAVLLVLAISMKDDHILEINMTDEKKSAHGFHHIIFQIFFSISLICSISTNLLFPPVIAAISSSGSFAPAGAP